MKPYFETELGTLYFKDCRDNPSEINGVTAVVTDPPYGLDFMGKDWDHGVPGLEFWKLIMSSCLPGAPLMAFGGTRTVHRLVCAIEDAGWEIRDGIEYLHWIYGSGFPKSLDISKAIDKTSTKINLFQPFADYLKKKVSESELSRKEISQHFPSRTGGLTGCVWNWENAENVPTKEQFGILKKLLGLSDKFTELIDRVEAEREVIGKDRSGKNAILGGLQGTENCGDFDITAPATPSAKQWDGYGTALKPAHESICLAMKPIEKNFAHNAQKYGVAGLNIDGGRISTDEKGASREHGGAVYENVAEGYKRPNKSSYTHKTDWHMKDKGRWPSNIIHDGSPEVLKLFPETKSGAIVAGRPAGNTFGVGNSGGRKPHPVPVAASEGSAARFFYVAKASRSERERGCLEFNNSHPTVKPLELMKYLLTLVTMPERNLIYDPFLGSGTTAVACEILGLPWVACEKDEHSCEIAAARIEAEVKQMKLFS